MTRKEEILNTARTRADRHQIAEIELHKDNKQLYFYDRIYNAEIASFEAGAQWADEHPISSWISVKEELPYNNPNFIHFGFTNRVLVRDKKWNVFVAYMKKNKDNKWIWYSDIDDNFNLLSYITHWMYIPKIEKD